MRRVVGYVTWALIYSVTAVLSEFNASVEADEFLAARVTASSVSPNFLAYHAARREGGANLSELVYCHPFPC